LKLLIKEKGYPTGCAEASSLSGRSISTIKCLSEQPRMIIQLVYVGSLVMYAEYKFRIKNKMLKQRPIQRSYFFLKRNL